MAMPDNLDEMRQQGQALRELAEFYSRNEGHALLDQAADWLRAADRSLLMTGMGSSHFAGRILTGALAQQGRLIPRLPSDELLMLVQDAGDYRLLLTSQSGRSGELMELTEKFPGALARGMVVTNDPQSPLACACPLVLPLCAGREDYSATKTFTNTLALFRLLGARYNSEAHYETTIHSFQSTAQWLDVWVEKLDELPMPKQCSFFIGCDYESQAVAEQAGLLWKEVAHRSSEALTFAAFKHGAQEIAGAGPSAVFIARELRPEQYADVQRLAALGLQPLVLSGVPVEGLPSVVIDQAGAGWPLLATMVVELWVYRIALQQGLRPGHYQVGEKVTA